MFPATKFRPPTPGVHSIARHELLAHVRGERPAVLIARAPAGYGKTTAVAQWLGDVEAGDAPMRRVWVSLDEDDDDPVGLWAAIATAAEGAGLGDATAAIGSQRAGGVRAGTIVPLLEAFAASAAVWVLVLDYSHLLSREYLVASLDWFLGRTPDNLTTVALTRASLELPAFERLRANGRALEVGISALRLDAGEIERLLRDSFNLDAEDADVARVDELTGGWPAAVSLVASALARGVPIERVGAQRIDDGRLDALVREGLAGSSADDHVLLRQLSVFERFDVAALEAVVRDPRAWPLAMAVADRTGLIATLDDHGRWWRLHHLVRDRLAADLERADPALRRELHRRAVNAFDSEHDVSLTMHHLLGAEEYDTIADVLSNVRANAIVPRQALGLSWLERIPESALNRDPRLAFWEAWATATGGDSARRDRALARGRIAAGAQSVDAFRTWDDVEDFVHSMACYDDVGAARRAGERFLARYDDSSPLTALVTLRLATMLYLEGRCDEAMNRLDLLDEGAPLARPLRVLVPAYRALCRFELGDKISAAVEVDRIRQARIAFGLGQDPVYLPAEQALARLLTQSGDPTTAHVTASNALETARQQGDTVLVVPHLLLELARADLALGRTEEAVISLNRAEELSSGFRDPGVLARRIAELRPQTSATASRGQVAAHDGLSRRELEVLALLPSSLSASEIASELFVSTNTARSHIKSIHRKLGVTNRDDAVAASRRAGLIP